MRYVICRKFRALVTVVGLALLSIQCGVTALGQEAVGPLPRKDGAGAFQRVLIKPGAELFSVPGDGTGKPLAPLKPFYVYTEENEWLGIGFTSTGGADGWVLRERTIDWPHNIIGAWTTLGLRRRQVLFETKGDLKKLVMHESYKSIQEKLVLDVDEGQPTPDWAVVAVEPTAEEFPDIYKPDAFYIMPILDFAVGEHPASGDEMLFMQVAYLPLRGTGTGSRSESGTDTELASKEQFDVGVMFVIDTTLSMGPYINATREAVESLVLEFEGAGDREHRVHFGLIGFRDNPQAKDSDGNLSYLNLEYRKKLIAEFDRQRPVREFLTILREVKPASVSSEGFTEDSFAGLERARRVNWEPNGQDLEARFIVLITDAGPKRKSNRENPSEVKWDAKRMHELLAEENIHTFTLHLKTKDGSDNHDDAEKEYKTISPPGPDPQNPNVDAPNYFGVPGGQLEEFEKVLDQLLKRFKYYVSDEYEEWARKRASSGHTDGSDPTEQGASGGDSHALAAMMRYVGKGTAPEIGKGWITNRAVEIPSQFAIKPHVLLSKNQLSELVATLTEIMNFMDTNIGEEGNLFSALRERMTRFVNDPELKSDPEMETLGGISGITKLTSGMVTGLPYLTPFISTTEDSWSSMGTGDRFDMIEELENKIGKLKEKSGVHDDSAVDDNEGSSVDQSERWIKLGNGDADGDYVRAIPFGDLP